MTREQRRKQVKQNRISLAVIIVELIIVCILIPIAISKFGNKKGSSSPDDGEPIIEKADANGNLIGPGNNASASNEKEGSNGTQSGKEGSSQTGISDQGNKSGSEGSKNTEGNQSGEGNKSGEGAGNETGDGNGEGGSEGGTPGRPAATGPLKEVIAEADIKAMMYDYDAAIELVKSNPAAESDAEAQAAIKRYEEDKAKCVKWADNTQISHIFVHSLIVDTSRAFGPKSTQVQGYNQYMTTVSEFNKMIEQMYAKGYVLISMHDIAKVVTGEDGKKKLQKQAIMLPPGKTPFVLSQDDVNYYQYMDNDGGFADRLVIGEDGLPTCQYTDINGNVSFGEYDVLPIIDRFVKDHPDFSYRGAKGILAVTGYEGALGYDTGLSMKMYDGLSEEEKMKRINAEREKAKAVADAIKADGWEFASHSYTHSNMSNVSVEKLEYDCRRWKEEVEIILGPTDIYIYPYGADICSWRGYSGEKYDIMKKYGFWYFCNVDSARYWIQLTDGYMRMGRVNTDGERMHLTLKNLNNPDVPNRLEYFFDVTKVYDNSRPAWPD
jgi:peptidoglycan/xylan/chitin deacetylase (PgdA/CDA1 family)